MIIIDEITETVMHLLNFDETTLMTNWKTEILDSEIHWDSQERSEPPCFVRIGEFVLANHICLAVLTVLEFR